MPPIFTIFSFNWTKGEKSIDIVKSVCYYSKAVERRRRKILTG